MTNISSTQIVRGSSSPFENDPFFRYFFGDDDPFGNRERRAQSLGSGVIVSSDGYLLTNNHVVGDVGAQISVVLGDKREMPAKVVGVDEMTDIAVLKIDARNLPMLPWGDSSKLKVAEWVLAIGNPFQLNQTVTLGIVSATGRSLSGRLATYEDFIQTDAAINPGNSGGALINARGELVGINTAIYSESGGYSGIGFAVPSNLAQHVMDDLIKFGEVRRGTIPGIKVQPMTTQMAQQLGAPNTRGALVVAVDQRSEAYRAGLVPGDIIVSFNGANIDDTFQFVRLLSDSPIGTTVTLGVLRQTGPAIVKRGGHAGHRRASDAATLIGRGGAPVGVVQCSRSSAGSHGRSETTPRHRDAAAGGASPLRLDPDVDPDATAPLHVTRGQAAILDAQRARRQIAAIVPQRDPERPGEIAGAAAERHRLQRGGRAARAAGAAAPHQRLAVERLERADQHRGRRALGLGDGVHEVVDTVIQVDVGDTRTPVERRIARGRSGRRVAGRIRFADVGLDLDDHARGDAGGRLVHQDLADQIARDLERGTGVERPRQDRGGRHPGRRRITAAS